MTSLEQSFNSAKQSSTILSNFCEIKAIIQSTIGHMQVSFCGNLFDIDDHQDLHDNHAAEQIQISWTQKTTVSYQHQYSMSSASNSINRNKTSPLPNLELLIYFIWLVSYAVPMH